MFSVKKISSIFIFVLAIIVVSGFPELKIGYINSDVILAKYHGTKEAEQKLKEEYAKWEKQATDMQNEITKLKDQLEKQSLMLSEQRKKELQEQLQKKWMEYQKFLQEKFGQQGEAVKKNDELLKPIVEKINAIIEKIAKEENYDFILDTKAGVIYAKKAYDLTDKVVQKLNSGK